MIDLKKINTFINKLLLNILLFYNKLKKLKFLINKIK